MASTQRLGGCQPCIQHLSDMSSHIASGVAEILQSSLQVLQVSAWHPHRDWVAANLASSTCQTWLHTSPRGWLSRPFHPLPRVYVPGSPPLRLFLELIERFLAALQRLPGAPNVCLKVVSFTNDKMLVNWLKPSTQNTGGPQGAASATFFTPLPMAKSSVAWCTAAVLRASGLDTTGQTKTGMLTPWLGFPAHAALDCLAEKYTPDAKDDDKRDNEEEKPVKQNPNDEDPVYGTYYFSMWCPQGHGHESPVLSGDLRGSGKKMNAAGVFLKHITPLTQTIGMVFEAANKKVYHDYLRIFHRQLDITALDPLHTTRRMCFMGIAINRNNRVTPHKDVKDPSPTSKKDGSTLVIFDVDCETPQTMPDDQPWCLKHLSFHYTFYERCLRGETRQHPIARVWYNQDESHKVKGKCLQHSLAWLREMAGLGDEELKRLDWAARNFAEFPAESETKKAARPLKKQAAKRGVRRPTGGKITRQSRVTRNQGGAGRP